jgi:hypothetical protein
MLWSILRLSRPLYMRITSIGWAARAGPGTRETATPSSTLFSKYKLRMESKGKKVKSGGGFGETGFKYAEAEDQYTTEKKKYQKAALGLQVRIFLQ